MSTDRGMDKEDVAHIYNRKLLSHEKWNNAICSNTDDLDRDYHTKSDRKDKYFMISLICKINFFKKWTYSQNRNRLTGMENKLMVTKEEMWGGGGINQKPVITHTKHYYIYDR